MKGNGRLKVHSMPMSMQKTDLFTWQFYWSQLNTEKRVVIFETVE
jgi:hypothetical protein